MKTKKTTATKKGTKTTKRAPLVKRAGAPAKRTSASERRITPKRAQKVEQRGDVTVITAPLVLSAKGREALTTAKPRAVRETSVAVVTTAEGPRTLTRTSVDTATLPPALQTGQGRRWAQKVASSGWTVETMPARDFALMASAISRRAVEDLFDRTWGAIAKARGFDPDAKKTRAPSAGSAGLGLSPDALRSVVAHGRQRGREPVEVVQRALVRDQHLVVPVSTLPVGSTFKTADDCATGVRGWTGTVARHGIGSTSITGGRWDYIAPGAAVVPLVIAEQTTEAR